MVELVNAADSKSAGGNTLRVRVSLPAPEFRHRPLRQVLFFVPCIRRRGRFSAYRGPVFRQKQRRYLSFHVSESLSALQTEGAHGRARCTARGRKLPVPSFKAQSLSACSAFFGKWPGIVMLPVSGKRWEYVSSVSPEKRRERLSFRYGQADFSPFLLFCTMPGTS